MNRSCRFVVLLALGLGGACSTPPAVPDDSYFRLQASQIGEQFSQPVLAGVLLVEMPMAVAVRRGRKMIYSADPEHLRFQQYHYHHWEDGLPRLIRRHLTEVLDRSGIANAAVDLEKGHIDHVLASRIERFDRLLSDGLATAHVEIEFWLTSKKDPDRILLQHKYQEKIIADSLTIESTVIAFSTALEQINKRLLHDLGQVTP